MAGKEHEVVRQFRHTNPKTGEDKVYTPGDAFSGEVSDYMTDPRGPDDKGPLLIEMSASKDDKAAAVAKAAEAERAAARGLATVEQKADLVGKTAPANDSSNKEK